jgi:hypothetical protein
MPQASSGQQVVRARLLWLGESSAGTAALIRETNGSPEGAKTADDESDRAMSLLRKAVAGGFRDVAYIKRDKDLDALRDRHDFRKLMSALESARE